MSEPTATETALPLSGGLTAFLLRVAAYFQGYLSSFPCLPKTPLCRPQGYAVDESLTLVDATLAETSGPLVRVRMNRALRRRMRWLVRRGRMTCSGRHSVADPQIDARCNLTPGQMAEYCIRHHGVSRVAAYGLGLSRHLLRLCGLFLADMQGDKICLRKALTCAAPLSPD